MKSTHRKNAKIFKAFCDETRLTVLELLQSGEKCACVLLEKVDVCQSTLSHHMKVLVESGIVNARESGKWTYYSINEQQSQKAIALLTRLTTVTETADSINEKCCK